MKPLTTLLALAAQITLLAAQNIDLQLNWNRPGNNPNDLVFNIRSFTGSAVLTNVYTWPVVAVLTNATSHWMYFVAQTQFFAITMTNPITGAETADGIGPVHGVAVWNTNTAALKMPEQQADTLLVKQSLQLWWNGPPNWQANGGIFNVRTGNPGSVISDYSTWPVAARVTNILNTKFYNVNPTQWYAVSFTNSMNGTESGEGISPIRAQYNWQGVTMAEGDVPQTH